MRITDIGKKPGWDGPLAIQLVADVNALAKAFGEAAPVGQHTHDRISGRYRGPKRNKRTGKATSTEFPRQGGRLRRWLLHKPNWQVVYKQGSFQRASISIFLAYARIIDQGGSVPAAGVERGLAMAMAYNAGGQDVFAKYRRGYQIQPQNYVQKGLDLFMSMGYSNALKVGWRPSTSGG